MVRADLHSCSSANHVVDLVFVVRLLRIGAAFWQSVDACAESSDAEKFKIALAAFTTVAGEIVDVEERSHMESVV